MKELFKFLNNLSFLLIYAFAFIALLFFGYTWFDLKEEYSNRLNDLNTIISSLTYGFNFEENHQSQNSMESFYRIEVDFMRNWWAFITFILTILTIVLPLFTIRFLREKEKEFKDDLKKLKSDAENTVAEIKGIAKEAKISEEKAKISEENVKISEEKAKISEENAQQYNEETETFIVTNLSKGDSETIETIEDRIKNKKFTIQNVSEFCHLFNPPLEETPVNIIGKYNLISKMLKASGFTDFEIVKLRKNVKYCYYYLLNKNFKKDILDEIYLYQENKDKVDKKLNDLTYETFLGWANISMKSRDFSVYNYFLKILDDVDVDGNVRLNIGNKIKEWKSNIHNNYSNLL